MREPVAGDGRPPLALVRMLNPIMRAVLRSPLGSAVKPFALLEFTGRRSGRRYRVPVGWYDADGRAVVFSPAGWRVNFDGGRDATVRHRGRTHRMTGTLVREPATVAAALQSTVRGGVSAKQIGIAMPSDHTITAADVVHLDRAAIFFD